nr:hypothetical protein KPHV_63180 [Kitasatospora purpeofusca]
MMFAVTLEVHMHLGLFGPFDPGGPTLANRMVMEPMTPQSRRTPTGAFPC